MRRLLTIVLAGGIALLSQTSSDYFVISVVDEATGRGVPMVELKTTSNVVYYTDSNGLVAFHEPGLMGRRIYFNIKSHGYEYPADGLGYRGRALDVKAGGAAVVKVRRTEIAERMYRINGVGIYRDTVLAGRKAPIDQPLVNGGVSGADGPQTVVYRGKVYWFFGDTGGLSYPLGNFAVTGGLSDLPQHGGLDPSIGLNLRYFLRPDGFVKGMLDLPGDGPKWLSGLMVLPDPSGQDRLLAAYQRVGDGMAMKETGLILFDDKAAVFHKLAEFPIASKVLPDGRPFLVQSHGEDYYYQFRLLTLPWIRVKARWEDVQHLANYEAYTCYRSSGGTELERDSNGRLVCGWKRNADPMLWEDQNALLKSGKLKADEAMWQVRDVETGQQPEMRMGTVFWNAWRKRWVAILQKVGDAVYFAEADTPVGPWVYARKVAEFDRYTFYWPGQLPYFDQNGGKTIYFAGSYTAEFSSAPVQTPYYDYTVLMYRLHLDDPRLALPAPVYLIGGRYLLRDGVESQNGWDRIEAIPFYAVPPQAPHDGLVAVGSPPLFYGLPANGQAPVPQGLAGKWACKADTTEFPLDLTVDGERVQAAGGDGTFSGGKLQLRLKDADGSYTLSGQLSGGNLAGTWQMGSERGTWRCGRVAEPAPKSPDLVPLYESIVDGARVYSTAPHGSAAPICRVWRNPMSLVLVDPATAR